MSHLPVQIPPICGVSASARRFRGRRSKAANLPLARSGASSRQLGDLNDPGSSCPTSGKFAEGSPAIALTKKDERYCAAAEAGLVASVAARSQRGQPGHSEGHGADLSPFDERSVSQITEAKVDRLRAAAAELVRIREEAGEALDRILVALDAIDGDPDLEDGGDAEPSLGASEWSPWGGWMQRENARPVVFVRDDGDQAHWAHGVTDDDREAGDDNGIADFHALGDEETMIGLNFPGGDFRGDGVAEARRMLAAFREARA